jgi:hydroxyacylglutathione hydrolase
MISFRRLSRAAALGLVVALASGAPHATAATKGVVATDGYFDVTRIDPDTYAIHEPRYWQRNVMYVLKGETRAILFDTGSGTRDIAFVADKVTKKPMTAVASHGHYDHIGSHASFQSVAMIDLPETRSATDAEGWYSPPASKSLYAFSDGFHVTEWWKPGETIDIGGRKIDVVHVPGHSTDSIALVDRERGYAFVGDMLYGGTLYANLPGSDVAAYLSSVRRLLTDYPEIRMVYGAHEDHRLKREDLVALEKSLADIVEKRAAGEGLWWLAWTSSRYPGQGFSILAP